MNVHTYLRYNNIALVDPEVPFHSSCIKQFNEKGYLSSKQLEHLRSWSHSPEAITRLTAGIEEQYNTVAVPEVTIPAVKQSRWDAAELEMLFTMIASAKGTPTVAELATKLNRSESAVQGTLYKHSECAIKRGRVLYCAPNEEVLEDDELPF